MRQLSQRAIQAFLMTFRMGSISAASEVLNLTQPAISRLLKDLEEDIGFPLFHRIRGRLHRTPEGTAFYEEVSRSFVSLERLQMVADSLRQGHRFRLVICSMPAIASTCMPRIIAEFLTDKPDTFVTAHPLTSDEIITWVRDHQCNFGIIEPRILPAGIKSIYTHEEPAACILPLGHRLESRRVIRPEDLDGEAIIGTIEEAHLGGLVARMLRDRNIKSRLNIVTRTSYLIQKLVMEGLGLAIIDPPTAHLHAEQGGIVRPFSVPLIWSVKFIVREDTVLTVTEQRFVDLAIARLKAMSGDRRRR